MDGDDQSSSYSRKHRYKRDRHGTRKRFRDRRFEPSESKDDVSCCGHPRRRDYSPRQRHHHHRRRHKSRRRNKSRMNGTKEEIPSPLRPPTPLLPSQQPSASIAVTKEKPKDDKESAEITSTIQGKTSASAEVGTKMSSQMATSSPPPTLASRDSQKVEERESSFSLKNMQKTDLLQELCVTQCIRDGYEISRLAYTTCFPVSKKPNFIYLPQLRFMAKNNAVSEQKKTILAQKSESDLLRETKPVVDTSRNHKFDLSKEKIFTMDAKIRQFVQSLNECCVALRKASRNISNLELLAAGETLNEIHRYDTDTKAIINDLKYLRLLIDRKFEI
ncbi:hypothetical protein X798_02052 [Onchocerca flexuosa]|uniref:Uncharacterized protein n=1 Tax=Onchocerca flexuosa TaxID=387005 RepID=A0A238C1X3_9BILA|nr:hypothetical protein X798_02052 [Onchocerca flexuosa]